MRKSRGKWDGLNYKCSCGQVLQNTCKSMIKKHRKTKKHQEYLKTGVKVPEVKKPTYFVIKGPITITFD